jgi:AhpC/TSA family
MARSWIIFVLAFAALAGALTQADEKKPKDKDFKVDGKFTKDDPRDAERNGPAQTHVVPMKAGKAYKIDMLGKNVSSYLRLLDSKGAQLAEDGNGDLNALIVFNCKKDGDYKVVCTTFNAGFVNGNYTLTVKATTALPSSAHTQIIGKEAPDFAADFAVNGKPGKLSDLEGKIVLVDFCDIRNPQCIAMQAKLRDWHKAYKDKDLVIVSVMFYPSDIGQSLGFDEETGSVKTVKTADRKSDKALFAAFADHHKIEHRMLALSKQSALDAYNAYIVNGVPQVVVIDRKGMVRLIDIGGEKGAGTVETMLKKLIAEK